MTESFNHAVILVGPAGYGKTTIARCEVDRHLREYEHGLVFVHDVNVQFKDYCQVFDDIHAWKRAAAAAAATKTPVARGVSVGGEASDVTREVSELGQRFNRAEQTRVPILLVYDESSMMDASGSSFMGKDDTKLLSNRRHWGIAPLYNVQKPSSLMAGFYERATAVYVFSQTNEKATNALEENLGLPEGSLAPMIQAPKFRFMLWRREGGLSSGTVDGHTFKVAA